MALPNKPTGELNAVRDPEVEEREVDILIVGGGMAACGAAFEVKKWMSDDQSVLLVDKAALERSGAVAQGLSAINTYIGDNTPEDYVRMVRNDLMGIVREDLIFDLGCHVDDSVHLFEEWGLPIWKQSDDGKNLDGKKGQKVGTLKAGCLTRTHGQMADHDQRRILQTDRCRSCQTCHWRRKCSRKGFHRRIAAGCQQRKPDCRCGRFLRP